VLKSLYDANTVLAADTDNTPAAVTMGASTILARLAAGNIKAASTTEIKTLLALVASNISDFDTAVATTAVLKSLFDAHTVLAATSDNTPAALTVAVDTVVGRVTGGNITSLNPNSLPQEFNAQTGTTYTIATGDPGKLVTQSNASAITTTVPQDSDVTWAIGKWCELYQLGAGKITVVAGTGATLRATPTAATRAQYSRLFLQKISANTWALSGDIAAT
jgi:hypothetical protein